MSEQVHIRVGENRHKKWVDHANAEYDGNMSKLIRNAVENEIGSTSNGNSASGESQTVEANGRIDDILVGVEDNGKALDKIQRRLTKLQDDVITSGMPEPELVFSDVYGEIPTVGEGVADTMTADEAAQLGATPSEIAENVDMSEKEVYNAVVQLHYEYDDVGMLHSKEHPEPHFWRVE